MKENIQRNLSDLYEEKLNDKVVGFVSLPASGSNRFYYRIKGEKKSAIGVFNKDRKENIAFLTYSRYFHDKGLNVPEIFAEDLDNDIYIQQDLGDITLYSLLNRNNSFDKKIIQYYQNVIEELVRFQIEFSKDIDYSVSYPRDKFDKQSMMWDLNYFKYYFLKLGEIKFDEQSLENDFNKFTDFLLNENHDYFLYRDFQSRNIMIFENKPYFIDYQGGRKGALQYDIASLIFDAKANIPTILKTQLLEYYIECLGKYTIVDKAKFINYYYGYCLLRIMQAMGAYGYRGFYEKKEHFLTSIPFAVNNLNNILKNNHPAVELPELDNCWNQIIQSTHLRDIVKSVTNLNVHIQSFSYRKGIPVDEFGNGGGFVFDCRFIKNPGLFQEYKNLTGNDFEVIDFLNKEAETDEFLENIYSIIDKAVEKYKQKNYNHLMVSFGCTGGQHRSVHCANMLYRHLHKQNDINVFLKHREI